MPLTILSDTNVKELLENLSRLDVEALQQSLRHALHEYSTGTQDSAGCESNQPERSSLTSAQGLTTLFMPSTSSSGLGIKVVTLAAPSSSTTFQPFKGDATPKGSLTIMSPSGAPTGFLNAEEITAFRTALASTLLLCRRTHLKTLTVFGAGKQAYWHIRLALLLRGHHIRHINIINRTLSLRTKGLLRSFLDVPVERKKEEGWQAARFAIMSPEYGEYNRVLKEQLRAADAIITTVPSTEPLFDHTLLTSTEGRRKGRLVISIGSYKPHMIELPIELLHQAVRPAHDHRHFHKHAAEGGVVVVDTLTGCLKEAGEIIQAGLIPRQLVEIGELVMLEDERSITPTPSSATSQSHPSEPSTPSSSRDSSSYEPLLDQLSLADSSSSSSLSGSYAGRPAMASVLDADGHPTVNDNDMNYDGAASSSSSRTSGRSNSLSRALSFGKKGKHSRSLSAGSSSQSKSGGKDDEMSRWLSDGNVIYKSVGLGLMDLTIGSELVKLAVERGIGTTIHDF